VDEINNVCKHFFVSPLVINDDFADIGLIKETLQSLLRHKLVQSLR